MAESGRNNLGVGPLGSLALDYQSSSDDNEDISVKGGELDKGGLIVNSDNLDGKFEKDGLTVDFDNSDKGKLDEACLIVNSDNLNEGGELNKGDLTFEVYQISSDQDSDDSESDKEELDNDDLTVDSDNSDKGVERNKVDLTFEDLPPIEDLKISVAKDECKPIGTIKSFVDPLVVVEGYPGLPALNLDTVLFIEEGDKALGHVFDVIGPVKQPHYCVRFNSKDHMKKRGVEIGMIVYCAPSTKYTTYVFLAQLEKLKGSDASWKDDVEPPPEELEASDDELDKNNKPPRRRTLKPRRARAANNSQQGYVPRPVPGFMPRARPRYNMGRPYGQFQYPQPNPYDQMANNYYYVPGYAYNQVNPQYNQITQNPQMYQHPPPFPFMSSRIPNMAPNRNYPPLYLRAQGPPSYPH